MKDWNPVRVRQLMAEQGRTRKWVADQCGITPATLTHILTGRRPGLPVQKLLASALGVTVEDLVQREAKAG